MVLNKSFYRGVRELVVTLLVSMLLLSAWNRIVEGRDSTPCRSAGCACRICGVRADVRSCDPGSPFPQFSEFPGCESSLALVCLRALCSS